MVGGEFSLQLVCVLSTLARYQFHTLVWWGYDLQNTAQCFYSWGSNPGHLLKKRCSPPTACYASNVSDKKYPHTIRVLMRVLLIYSLITCFYWYSHISRIHKGGNNQLLLFPLVILRKNPQARSWICLWIQWKIVAKISLMNYWKPFFGLCDSRCARN